MERLLWNETVKYAFFLITKSSFESYEVLYTYNIIKQREFVFFIELP